MSTSTAAAATPAVNRADGLTVKVAAGLLLAIAAAVVAVVVHQNTGNFWVDVQVYREGGASVLHGDSPYDFVNQIGLVFTNSPFSAVLFTPLAMVSVDVAIAAWTFVSVLALEALVWVLLGHVGVRQVGRRATLTLAVTVAMVPLSPILTTLWAGQVNLLLVLLIVADLVRPSGKFRGIGVGIAAGVKLTPLIFVPYFLITRKFREAAVSLASFAGTVLVGFVFVPSGSVDYWSGMFVDTSRIVPPGTEVFNQSIRGMLTRLPDSGWHNGWLWLGISAVVGVGGLLVAARASRAGHELTGIVACAITGLLISPVSWQFHWVWCVPLLVLAGRQAWLDPRVSTRLQALVVWLAFLVTSYWAARLFLAKPIQSDAWTYFFTNLFVLVGVVVLIGVAVGLHRADRRALEEVRI